MVNGDDDLDAKMTWLGQDGENIFLFKVKDQSQSWSKEEKVSVRNRK